MDNCSHSVSIMVVGINNITPDGRVYSSPSCNRHRGDSGTYYPGSSGNLTADAVTETVNTVHNKISDIKTVFTTKEKK